MAKSCNILKYLVLTCLMVIAFPELSYSQIHTTRLEPAASLFSWEEGYQVAGIYWLPDYLKDNTSRDYNTNAGNNDDGGGDVDKTCETYGFVSPESLDLGLYDCSEDELRPVYGLLCYTDCACKSKFQYNTSNCDTADGYVLSGASCDGKYETCACREEFQYTSSNCSGEYLPAGESCGGKYNKCEGRPCSDGGLYDSKQSGLVCSAKSYGGKTCYSCYDPCDGLMSKSCPYGCEKTYDQCSEKCESCYEDNCRNRNGLSCQYGCQSYYADCASKCEYCRACSNSCEEGYSLTACSGTGVTAADTKVNQCGNICYKCQCQTGYADLDNFWCGGALRCWLQ